MSAWARTWLGAALLRTAAFKQLLDRRDVFFQGFLVVVLAALIVGLPALARGVVTAFQPRSNIPTSDEIMTEIDRGMAQFAPFIGALPAEARQQLFAQIKQDVQAVLAMIQEITSLNSTIPPPIRGLLQAVGHWASRALVDAGLPLTTAALGTWLGYGIWVMLAAKLLGGKGTLAGFFGASAAYAVPHVLSFFAFVPVIGALLGLVGFLWGLTVYVRATAVSHELTVARAFLAVILPILLAIVLALILLMVYIGFVVIFAGALHR